MDICIFYILLIIIIKGKGDQAQILGAMQVYESLTCFRFKERKSGQTNADVGAKHNGYLKFVNRGDG